MNLKEPPPSEEKKKESPPDSPPPKAQQNLPPAYHWIIFSIVILTTLYVARGFLLPVFAALLLSYTFIPIVRFLNRLYIPRIVASLIVVTSFSAMAVYSLVALSGPALKWLENAPESFDKLESIARSIKGPMENMDKASKQLDQITDNENRSEEVVVRVQESSIAEVILNQTPIVIGGAISTLILLFFLLAFGDVLLRRSVESSKSFGDKRRAVETARQIEYGVSNYLVTVSLINISLGITLGLVLWALGFKSPVLWGTLAAAFNFIPYLGAFAGVGLLTLASISTIEPMSHAFIYPAAYLALTTLEGNFITPMVLGRSFTINPIFIILVLLFLGWLWGIAGAVMAVPILIGVKCAAEQFESTQPLARLMAG